MEETFLFYRIVSLFATGIVHGQTIGTLCTLSRNIPHEAAQFCPSPQSNECMYIQLSMSRHGG